MARTAVLFRRGRRGRRRLFGPVGAIAGRLVGAIGGNVIDHALFGGSDSAMSKVRALPIST